MATVAENLQTILDIKNDIKTAIEGKGVAVGDVSFTEYSSKIDSIETGGGSGGSDVNTRVLDITENGTYVTDYTQLNDLPLPDYPPSGYYPTEDIPFYGYADTNKTFSTGIYADKQTKLEFWFIDNDYKTTQWTGKDVNYVGSFYDGTQPQFTFMKCNTTYSDYNYVARIGDSSQKQIMVKTDKIKANEFNHIIMSIADGLWVNGEKIGDFNNPTIYSKLSDLCIGSKGSVSYKIGVVKINDTIFIPSTDGILNTTTNTQLTLINGKTYTYAEPYKVPELEGDLYRTVNVNIQPKINLAETGLKLGYSKFAEVPDWIDWDGITDMGNMFYGCDKVISIPMIDTSNVTNMNYMFYNCYKLASIPMIDTSNVTNMYDMFGYCNSLQTIPLLDTSNVTEMEYCFYYCTSLKTIPQLDTGKAEYVNNMFGGCSALQSIPLLDFSNVKNISYFFGYSNIATLTDLGGFKNLKLDWKDNYGLYLLPNLTYESIMNVINNLYNFVANGETTTRTLKINSNTYALLSESDIAVATAKGWTISK